MHGQPLLWKRIITDKSFMVGWTVHRMASYYPEQYILTHFLSEMTYMLDWIALYHG